MSKLPPFQNNLRVVQCYSASGPVWRIDVRHPGQRSSIKGVDMTAEAFNEPDERCLGPALAALNRSIAGWPVEPVTVERVRELAG